MWKGYGFVLRLCCLSGEICELGRKDGLNSSSFLVSGWLWVCRDSNHHMDTRRGDLGGCTAGFTLRAEKGPCLVFKPGGFEILSPGFCSLFWEEVSIQDTEIRQLPYI